MWQNESLVTLLYQTLCTWYCLICACMLSERVLVLKVVILFSPVMNEARTSLPYSSVYHIWAWICCFYPHHYFLCFHAAASRFYCLIGRSGSSYWTVGCGVVWVGLGVNEACHMIAKPYCINLLHIPLWMIVVFILGQNCICTIAKCLNIVQIHFIFFASNISYCKTPDLWTQI